MQEDDMREVYSSYESEETVRRVDAQYKIYKEKFFFSDVFRRIPPKGIVLEVGGGTGFQGRVISGLIAGLYIHSDYSFAMCHSAKKKGHLSVRIDGLNMAVAPEAIDIIIAIELSTIIHSASLRYLQFQEFYRVIKKGGYLVLETGLFKKGLHCTDKDDMKYLEDLGFQKVKVSYWGAVPGRFWNRHNATVLALIEGLLSKICVGIRKTLILRKS